MPANQNIDREQTRYDDPNTKMRQEDVKLHAKLAGGLAGCGAVPGGPLPSWASQGPCKTEPIRPTPFSDLEAFASVGAELGYARLRFPEMASAHEGWAIIKEEVDELWNEVKRQPSIRDLSAMQKEAVQIAAMAIRFLIDVR